MLKQGLGTLPSNFRAVEYIESTGQEFFYLPSFDYSDCDIEFKVRYFNGKSDINSFGALSESGNIRLENGLGWGGGHYSANYGGSGFECVSIGADTEVHVFRYDKTGVYIDGNKVSGRFYYGNEESWGVFAGELSLRFFGTHRNNAVRTSPCAIYAWKCTKSGKDLINLIPCYNKSTNETGMYDVVSHIFHTNEGSGSFIKGPDI